jgi:hypothetical protein
MSTKKIFFFLQDGPPQWLNDAFIYIPLVALFDQEIELLTKDVREKQRDLRERLESKKAP